jgi:serine phosphatase RsbU (regulator of sigma subunit)
MQQLQCMEVWGGNQAVDNGVMMPGLDAWVVARPHMGDASGGDIHYLSSCATGRITRLMVADVSGHGESASETATALRKLMRKFINHLDQRRAVGLLNQEFGRQEHSGRFATAILGTFWGPTGNLTLCNAGHPRPIWYRARTKKWEIMDPGVDANEDEGPVDVPLGVLDTTTYRQIEVRLKRGDLVLLYTDSLVEARLPDNKLLGEAGLLAALNRVGHAEPSGVIAALLAEFERMGAVINDDLTALLLRSNGLMPRLTIGDRARALVHVVRGLFAVTDRPGLPEFSHKATGGFISDRLNR